MYQGKLESNRAGSESSGCDSPAIFSVQLLGGLKITRLNPDTGTATPLSAADASDLNRFRTHKVAMLLARLLLHPGRSHSRDELADWLWPELPVERSRANLSQTLLLLRRQFAVGSPMSAEDANSAAGVEAEWAGLTIIHADHRCLRLHPTAIQTDVAKFLQGVQRARVSAGANAAERRSAFEYAVAAYTGDLLPGFFDDWILSERTRLRDLFDDVVAAHDEIRSPVLGRDDSASERCPPAAILPLRLTRFFGREREREQAIDLLTGPSAARLITLIGMGGIGKTRLASELAHLLAAEHSASFAAVLFVALAESQSSAQFGDTLLRAVCGDVTAPDPVAAVSDKLTDLARTIGRRALLVLDNLEQLGENAAPIVSRLLASTRELTILATSRQPIGVAGEREIPVGPLTSADDGTLSPDVALFADRSRLVRPGFSFNDEDGGDVKRLCALLEGVPLALELAAAWMRTLTPAQIVERLGNRFEILALRGVFAGEVPKRHRSLRAALMWSIDLLPPSLRLFFAQLSVFRGGWTADAAQAVTGLADVGEPLLLLTERSLILAEESGGAIRYRMLESLREFAAEQTVEMPAAERTATPVRHVLFFDSLADRAEQIVESGRGYRFGLALVADERDNLRAALETSLCDGTLRELPLTPAELSILRCAAVNLSTRATRHWAADERRAYLRRAEACVADLPLADRDRAMAAILVEQGHVALALGDAAESEHLTRHGLKIAIEIGDDRLAALARKRLGGIAMRTGLPAAAVEHWHQCLHFYRQAGEPVREAGILYNISTCTADRTEEKQLIEQAVALYRRHAPNSHYLAMAINGMGGNALTAGEFGIARQLLEEAHDLALADGAAGMIAVAKGTLGELAVATGEDVTRGDALLAEAQAIFASLGEPPSIAAIADVRFQLALRRRLPEEALTHARAILCNHGLSANGAAESRFARHQELVTCLSDAGFPDEANDLHLCAD